MSVGLHGGPADGHEVQVSPCPWYLRVAIEPEVGGVAVLRRHEAPQDGEQVAVYVRPGEVLRLHGQDPVASYVWLEDADGDELRDPAAWQAWATGQPRAGMGRVGEVRWPLPAGDGSGS